VKTNTISTTLALFALTMSGAVQAVEFNGSGFLTMAAGKVFSTELSDGFLVTDYGQAGIYDDRKWDAGPDSKLGVQGVFTFNPQWSVTGQAVIRGARNGKGNLEWLYASYQPSDNVTLQFGRKRLPLFYYSESQDVGLSMPWVRLPAQAYGWDVVNFTGANAIFRSSLGEWTSAAEVYLGNENRKNNPYQQIYTGRGIRTDEKWTNIVGGDWTLTRDWLELRFSAMRSNWETYDPATDTRTDNGRQTFLSAAAMIDYGDWVIRSEVSKIDRPTYNLSPEHDWAALLGVGYRIGKWLPMVTYAQFHGNYTDPTVPDERTVGVSLSLRYDLTSSSALKVQYDNFRDNSTAGITCFQDPGACAAGSQRYGHAKMITLSYDKVF
jgi:hypothetical protein